MAYCTDCHCLDICTELNRCFLKQFRSGEGEMVDDSDELADSPELKKARKLPARTKEKVTDEHLDLVKRFIN